MIATMTPGSHQDAMAVLAELARGEVSATEVVTERLAALHELHGRTGAVAAFDDDRARADAAELDRAFIERGPVGPFHGLPVTIKDWIDVEGFPCEGLTSPPVGRRPSADATAVARLRAAGVVVLAKTHAWGPTDPGHRVRHPLDPDRTPGGSSTGEGVAVASGVSPLGLGSDSGGSIRLPAAWCGTYGFKPTAGLVPTTGHFPRVGPLGDGRTQIGPLCRDLDLVDLVLAVIAGPDGHDPGVVPVPRRRAPEADLSGASFAVVLGEGGWWPTPAVACRCPPGSTRRACPWPSNLSLGAGRTTGCWRQRPSCPPGRAHPRR